MRNCELVRKNVICRLDFLRHFFTGWLYGGKILAFEHIFLLQILVGFCNNNARWRAGLESFVPDYLEFYFYMEDFYQWQRKKSL